MLKNLLRLVVLGLVLAGLWFGYLMAAAGEFRGDLEEDQLPGECVAVPGLVGAEDLTVDRASAKALISSFDRRAWLGGEAVQGAIYALPLKEGALEPELLTADFPGTFRPHGVSLHTVQGQILGPGDTGGETSLLVINHTDAEDVVEVFGWNGTDLKHRRSVADEELFNLNDLVAVGEGRFYATRDHLAESGFMRWAEDYLRVKRGGVVYFDGETTRVVAENLGYPNGIAISPDGLSLYVAATTVGKIYHYEILEEGALELLQEFPVGSGVDNIEVDLHGKLWVASHPKLLTFVRHSSDPSVLSPTQAFWVDPDQLADPWLRQVYLESGSQMSGGSVAAPFGARILLGSVLEEHILVCQRS